MMMMMTMASTRVPLCVDLYVSGLKVDHQFIKSSLLYCNPSLTECTVDTFE